MRSRVHVEPTRFPKIGRRPVCAWCTLGEPSLRRNQSRTKYAVAYRARAEADRENQTLKGEKI